MCRCMWRYVEDEKQHGNGAEQKEDEKRGVVSF
jgi:hypothetical protein